MDREQARHAGAALIFRAHRVAGPLGGDHQHVDVGARLDEVEMHVEAVGEQQRGAVLQVGVQVITVDVALQFVGREHHDHVGPFGGFRHFEHLERLALRLLDALRARAQRHRDFLDAGIAQVTRMGVALAAIAVDGDLLALDQVQVGVAVVIYAHGCLPLPIRYCLGVSLVAALAAASSFNRAPRQALERGRLARFGLRLRSGREARAPHIPSGPRAIATMPVRDTSTRPSGSIRLMNWSIFSEPPVISNTKLSVVASTTRARNASESRSASTRLSPLPRTFTMASSRSIAGPAMVMSTTRWTGTMRSSWFLICSITIGVPRVTMVMRERCFSCSVSETVRLSML